MKKKYILIAVALVLLVGAGFWWLRTGKVVVSIDGTGSHTEADIRSCMNQVKGEYAFSTSGNRLVGLRYEQALGERREAAELEQFGGDEAIVILADFIAGEEAGAFTPGELYTGFQWIFTRRGNGPWKLKTCGYA